MNQRPKLSFTFNRIAFVTAVLFVSIALAPKVQGAGINLELKNLTFCDEIVPLVQTDVYEKLDQELLLLSEAKTRVWLTLRRQDRYLPIIEKALKESKLPLDLKYLPMALTNLDPVYRQTPRRGLWRLSESEASSIGLVVRKDLDERLDPISSTTAVMARLKSLKTIYGSWTLTTAAFLDEPAILKAISEAEGEKNYYNLYLPETLEKNMNVILAGKILYSAPTAYGYHLSHPWPILTNKRHKVEANSDLKTLASGYKVDYKTFRDMNPHILGDTAPAGVWINTP